MGRNAYYSSYASTDRDNIHRHYQNEGGSARSGSRRGAGGSAGGSARGSAGAGRERGTENGTENGTERGTVDQLVAVTGIEQLFSMTNTIFYPGLTLPKERWRCQVTK